MGARRWTTPCLMARILNWYLPCRPRMRSASSRHSPSRESPARISVNVSKSDYGSRKAASGAGLSQRVTCTHCHETAGRYLFSMTTAETLALGWQYYQAGQVQQAQQLYEQLAQEDFNNPDVWCYLGIVQRANGALADAAASYREALRLRPEFLEALNNLGNVLVALGKHN